MKDGVCHVYKDAEFTDLVDLNYCDREEFIEDHQHLVTLANNGTVKRCRHKMGSLCLWRRLCYIIKTHIHKAGYTAAIPVVKFDGPADRPTDGWTRGTRLKN